MQRECEIIKNARVILQASHTSRPSERTIADYKAKTKRLYALVKAGTDHGIEAFIVHAKQTRPEALRHGLADAPHCCTCSGRRLRKCSPSRIRRSARSRLRRYRRTRCSGTNGGGWSRAPAYGWSGSPGCWVSRARRLRIASHGTASAKICVACPTIGGSGLSPGCRNTGMRHSFRRSPAAGPTRLVKGVKLSIVGGELIAEIDGSKVTEKSGQPWRRLAWPVDSVSLLVAMLVEEVQKGLSIAKIQDAKTYSGAVRAAGEREWARAPKKRYAVLLPARGGQRHESQ
jgi:hypothetical protein